jgi:hypothetical protein
MANVILSKKQRKKVLKALQARFAKTMNRHRGNPTSRNIGEKWSGPFSLLRWTKESPSRFCWRSKAACVMLGAKFGEAPAWSDCAR